MAAWCLISKVAEGLDALGDLHVAGVSIDATQVGERWRISEHSSLDDLHVALEVPSDRFLVITAVGRTTLERDNHTWSVAYKEILETLVRADRDGWAGVFLPGRALSSPRHRDLRESVTATAYPRFVVQGPTRCFGEAAETLFGLESLGGLLLLGLGSEAAPPTAFLDLPGDESMDEALEEITLLVRQRGGRRRFGFVYAAPVDAGDSLGAARYSPERERVYRNLSQLGGVVALREVLEIVAPSEPAASHVLPEVAVLQGREISDDGLLRPLVERRRGRAPDVNLLARDDLCVRRIVAPAQTHLAIYQVRAADEPMAADDSIVVLRFRDDIDPGLRPFFVEYLRSPQCLTLMAPEGRPHEIDIQSLLRLAVPVPTDSLRLVLNELWHAERQLAEWRSEIAAIRRGVFASASERPQIVVARALQSGRLVRQRVVAATALDDLGVRVRTQMPFPVAAPWRRADTAAPDLEGYLRLLEVAEATICYLACIILSGARTCGVRLRAIDELAARAASGQRRALGFGDWSFIVDEAQGESFGAQIDAFPVPEALACLRTGSDAALAVSSLRERRNDQAHQRGPRSGPAAARAYDAARLEVLKLFEAVGFLADYPLRYIQELRWDSLSERATYDHRDLMGDHALVTLGVAVTTTSSVERGSLYVVDRSGKLHLLRPLLQWFVCPQCDLWSAWAVDEISLDRCSVRSLDHGHTVMRDDLRPALGAVGLLKV